MTISWSPGIGNYGNFLFKSIESPRNTVGNFWAFNNISPNI